MNKRAVVVGATGLIGKELVKLLLNEPSYTSVTLIVRRATDLKDPKLKEKVIHFDQLEETDVELTDADIFCTLGTTIKKAGTQETFRRIDYGYPVLLGRFAKSQGAKQYLIVTSMGANSSSSLFYSRVKGEVEEALQKLELPALHIFRPSLLLGKRDEFRLGEQISSSVYGILSPFFSEPFRKYKPIHAKSVAKAMHQIAQSYLSDVHVYESTQIAEKGEFLF